ncbi:hypothetical protein QVD17_18232 [Tagetes erecta]|uniref:Uncharacterized protein n=1 Tax=Tagetes erecta TaxID=13708 RepID=A0AAD8NVW7_TARER|nr:hypothetical protein QVD17_18230 [Tagetes erecta]KAK1422941.1 hypothetical protein QVD17_18231 [Tagetes erecta]KAK1422942.1 hypothetical protein QVD17_18232 [Tagetes erecta]
MPIINSRVINLKTASLFHSLSKSKSTTASPSSSPSGQISECVDRQIITVYQISECVRWRRTLYISFLFDFERLCVVFIDVRLMYDVLYSWLKSHTLGEPPLRFIFMVYVSEFSFSGAVDWENNHLQKVLYI